MIDLPGWHAHNKTERAKMVLWLNLELDQMAMVETQQRQKNFDEKECRAWIAEYGPEIDQAEHGNIEPLRKQLPALAKFLHLPKRKRGQRFQKLRIRPDLVRLAVDDVKRIRALWLKHYGKKNRHADDGLSAEQIAADRWDGVRVSDVINRMKISRLK
jgi:hypothetical protein